MRLKHLTLYASVLSLLGSTALAQQGKKPGQNRGRGPTWERMSSYDKDGDGVVTAEEFSGPEHAWERFDTDKDGEITEEEFNAAAGAMPQRPQRGGNGKPDNAPKVGTDAPEVSAIAKDTGDLVDLSSPARTTVLVFGSHT